MSQSMNPGQSIPQSQESTPTPVHIGSMSLDKIVEQIKLILNNESPGEEQKRRLYKYYRELELGIRNHERLARPRKYQFEGLRREIHEEGLQRLFEYIFNSENNRILKFDP